MIKVKITIARTQDLVGNYSSVSAKETAQAAYERKEEKADSLLDQSNAMTELNDEPSDKVTSIEARYGAADASPLTKNRKSSSKNWDCNKFM